MSVGYVPVQWNPQKKRYDLVAGVAALAFVFAYVGLGGWFRPEATVETLLIRSTASCAFVLLNTILALGPLSRLDPRWLPLLYNRRHLGVTFFCVCSVHAVLSVAQYHAFGDLSPWLSLLTSNGRFDSLSQFPFQLLGLGAWFVFLLMAATSHDFWLANLTAPVWKALHMMVYAAYAAVVAHVVLGAGQSQGRGVWWIAAVSAAFLVIIHLFAARREWKLDRETEAVEGWIEVPGALQIEEGRARIVRVGGERVAVFRDGSEFRALSNVCQHQNGPLGEGRIVDGCVTCPWHGFQYDAASGRAPAPFTERVPTFDTRVYEGRVFVAAVPRPTTRAV